MPNKRIWKKALVVGIIVLFIGVGIQPALANDVYINKEKKENTDESGASDDYQEIITFIFGYAELNWIKRRGIFRGEILLYRCPWCSGIDLFGLRRSNGGVEIYQEHDLDSVHVPRFIGLAFMDFEWGIAIGNIEWE